METESASNEEENNEQSKRDHIKERLTEMGVSQDSVRPKKSWFSRNINFLIISIIAILVGVFAIEYQSSSKMDAEMSSVAGQSPAMNRAANQPATGMMGVDMQMPSWPQPQYREQYPAAVADRTDKQQKSADNKANQNRNSGWYGQQGYYAQPQYQQYYGQMYQQPPAQSQPRIQQQMNTQNPAQRPGAGNRQPDYRGQYNGYNNGQYSNNNGPAYNPYYAPMPNPYSMPYPSAGSYNGWYR